jgi:hypothetical protein
VLRSIEEVAQTATLYGDHSFVLYAVTDGEENASRSRSEDLLHRIRILGDHWTVVCLVPDGQGVAEAKRHGFPAGNVEKWDPTSRGGVEALGDRIVETAAAFTTLRESGVRGTNNLFTLGVGSMNPAVVTAALEPLPRESYVTYSIGPFDPLQIESFVSTRHGSFSKGRAYYQLNKRETIQAQKEIIVFDPKTGAAWGGRNARRALGLPDVEMSVRPEQHPEMLIFVQSTSTTRKLELGTRLLVLR